MNHNAYVPGRGLKGERSSMRWSSFLDKLIHHFWYNPYGMTSSYRLPAPEYVYPVLNRDTQTPYGYKIKDQYYKNFG